jgi:hypothetical protein
MSNSNFPKTARIAIFAAAAATMVIALGATIGVTTQQAEAAKSGVTVYYCYTTDDPYWGFMRDAVAIRECNQDQKADSRSLSSCRHYKYDYGF